MKHLTEVEQYKLLAEIYKECTSKEQTKKAEIQLNLRTNSDTDTEILIRKGFKIYSFRCFGGNEFTFYERWNNYPNKIFSREGLKNEILKLLYNPN